MVSSADRRTVMGEFLVPLKWVGRMSVGCNEVMFSFMLDVAKNTTFVKACFTARSNRVFFLNSLRISPKKLQ